MIVIDATPGGATANSFVTEAQAIAYMANRFLNASAWTTFSGTTCQENEKSALCMATIWLSNLDWEGRRATTTQVLAWPRWSAINPDSPVGFLYDSTIIPDRVQHATIELALQFLNAGTTDISGLDPNIGVIAKDVGGAVSTRWQPFTRPKGIVRFPSVYRLIRPLLASSGNSVAIVRG